MPGPDTVAEEAPVVVALYLTLYFALAWIVLRGLRVTWQYSVGWLLAQLGKLPKVGTWRLKIDLGKPFRALNNDILNALETQAADYEQQMGKWFHAAARIQLWMVDETYALGRDVFEWGNRLQHRYLPRILHYATVVAFPWPTIYRAIHSAVEAAFPKVKHVAHEAARTVVQPIYRTIPVPYRNELGWLHRHWKALLAAVAGAGGLALPIPVTWPQFRRTWRELTEWRKTTARRLRRLEALLAASGLALAVANMTGTRVGCWRGRGNIARALRHVCGVPSWLLDVLLLGVIEAFVVSDLCRFSDLLISEAESLRPALLELVDVEDALIGCSGTVKPIDFALEPLSLPPMFGPSALAA